MTANSLLFWMSARRRGSWSQFRAAVEELHLAANADVEGEDDDLPDQYALPVYQALRFNLQRVGHAEFFAGAGEGADWRVTPPALAITQHAHGWLGVLAGARSLAFMEHLRLAAAEERVDLQSLTFPTYPDQILLNTSTQGTLAAIAQRTGILLQVDAPAALLASLPPVDDPMVRYGTELPFGSDWRIDRFSPDDFVWRSGTFSEIHTAVGGLYRFSLRHQRHVLYYRRGVASMVPALVGKYLVLHGNRRQVLRYDKQERTFCAPARCRPPFLIERALVLCSGSPPSYEGGQRGGVLRYREIPEDIAAIAASLLRQELR